MYFDRYRHLVRAYRLHGDAGGRSVCGSLIGGIVVSNPAEVMDVRFLCVCVVCRVDSDLCDGPITRSQESYLLCVIYKPQQRGGLGQNWADVSPKKILALS